MCKSALLRKLDVLVNWVGGTQFESVSLHCLSSDHPPPVFSLGRVVLSQLYLGPFPCGPRQQLSLSCSPHNASPSTHTHRQGSFANAISAQLPHYFSLFGPKDSACGRGCMVQALGRGMPLYRPPMLQSCDFRWWHTVQQLNCDSLFYEGTSQFLSLWQRS